MNKKGFVFIESILVLVVVALSISMLMSSYSLVARKTKEKEFYNKASDKYLLYSLSNMGTTETCNYGVSCSSLTNKNISFRADVDGSEYLCSNTKVGEIMYDCVKVFKDMNIKHLYVVENIRNELNDLKADGTPKDGSDKKAVELYDNGTIEYMKTLKKCEDIGNNKETNACLNPIRYMIGVFVRGNNDYYYASIELPEPETIKRGWKHLNGLEPVYLQQWVYYVNGEKVHGLRKLRTGNGYTSSTYYYYFDLDSGLMKMGWVYYDGAYHLFSPIDGDGEGGADGRRVQSMSSSERISVLVDNTKTYYLDNLGACYTCASGSECKCTSSDINETVVNISKPSVYNCNGDECN